MLLFLGNPKLPKWPTSQLFLCFYWMLVITMIATYNGNLIAFMAVKKIKVPVNTLEELANSDYQAGTLLGSAQHLLFQVIFLLHIQHNHSHITLQIACQ